MGDCTNKIKEHINKKYMTSKALPGIELLIGTSDNELIKTKVKTKLVTAEAYYIDTKFRFNKKELSSGWVIKLTADTAIYINEDDFSKYFEIEE